MGKRIRVDQIIDMEDLEKSNIGHIVPVPFDPFRAFREPATQMGQTNATEPIIIFSKERSRTEIIIEHARRKIQSDHR